MLLLSVLMMDFTICTQKRRSFMMTRSLEDIYIYYKDALDQLSKDHPHFEEIKSLLISQVNDELYDYDHTCYN